MNTVQIFINIELRAEFLQLFFLSFLNSFSCIYWYTSNSDRFKMVSNTEDNSNFRYQVKYYLENIENVWSNAVNVCLWSRWSKRELTYIFPWNKQKPDKNMERGC